MFKFVALLALVGLAAAGTTRYNQPQQYNTHAASSHSSSEEAHAEIQKLYSDVRADGFDYAVETSNGIYAQAAGDEHGNIHGEYHYVSHEGVPVKVTYVADEYGYQPASDLLPTPPPTPIAILKSLEYIRSHPAKEETSYYGKKH